MKKYTNLFALFLLLMQGCSKEDIASLEDPSAFAVDVHIENVQSRAVISGQSFANGSTIAVVVKNSNSGEDAYNGNSGIKKIFTLSGSNWTINSSLTLTQTGKVTAYYPYDLASPVINTDYTTLTPGYQSSIQMGAVSSGNLTLNGKAIHISGTETDYLVGSGTDVSQNAVRSTVTLRHVMAMVAIRLIKGTTYGGAALLTNIAIENKSGGNTLCSGTVNMQTNDFQKGGTQVSYTRELTYNALTPDQPGVYIGFLAYPAILYEAGLATLQLTVDSKTHTLDLPGNEQGDLHWRAGNCILYDVTMHGTKFEITGVTVAPWVSGSSEGNIEVQ